MHTWERCTPRRDARLREMHIWERCTLGEMHARERCTPGRDACLRYTSVKTPIKKIGTLIMKASTPVREMCLINVRVVCLYFASMSPLQAYVSHRYASQRRVTLVDMDFIVIYLIGMHLI
jgi:hypothetical protein